MIERKTDTRKRGKGVCVLVFLMEGEVKGGRRGGGEAIVFWR